MTSSVHRTVLWNLNGLTVLVVGVTVEAPLFAPSATYSASPMSNVIVVPAPNFIGMLFDRVATAEPFDTLPSHGSRIWVGIVRSPVSSTAIVFAP
jgi:hypothetical protein